MIPNAAIYVLGVFAESVVNQWSDRDTVVKEEKQCPEEPVTMKRFVESGSRDVRKMRNRRGIWA